MAVIALQISRVYRIILVLFSVGLLVFLYAAYTNNGSIHLALQLVNDDPSISASPSSAIIHFGKLFNASLNQIDVSPNDRKVIEKDLLAHLGSFNVQFLFFFFINV